MNKEQFNYIKGIEINDKSNKCTNSKTNKLQKLFKLSPQRLKRKGISYFKPKTNSNFDEIYI